MGRVYHDGHYGTIRVMSIAYEQTGRTRQKARTRVALLAATRELLAQGPAPTVEQAADRAGVSRTTAYRYFPNQRALLSAVYPEIEARSLLGTVTSEDPRERLGTVLHALVEQIASHEPELRAQLRLSLEFTAEEREPLPLRQGRAVMWIEDALEPLRGSMPEPELRRLTLAIRAAVGIEPLVWLTDVAAVGRDEALAIMASTAMTLLEAVLADRPAAEVPEV